MLVQLLGSSVCLAEDPLNILEAESSELDKSKLIHIPPINTLPVKQGLLDLFTLLKQPRINRTTIERQLFQLISANQPFNAAEQYLLLVVKALSKDNSTDKLTNSDEIIALLETAAKLSKQISDEQLSRPEFLQLHLILAGHYAKQGQFDLAYLEKKAYLKKYYSYRKSKRLAMIASLEQSFEVGDKKANNALLESQNKRKIRNVEEVQQQKITQQYNFTFITSAAIVFVLLFFRQLRIRNRLIKLTKTDALTGLANRSTLFEYGERMLVTFAEQPSEFSVLLLDLDHFKKINDNFGHQVGDSILIKIAELVKETMRSRDVFSRFGGEEFVALLPYADNNKARAIAMRINEKLAQHDFTSLIVQGKVTASIGVATMKSNEMSFEDLLHCADLAMYEAKEQGRNTVVCYQNIAEAQERCGI
jgi:diguanylate cyclase (GGDEF)-like protein